MGLVVGLILSIVVVVVMFFALRRTIRKMIIDELKVLQRKNQLPDSSDPER